MNHRDYMDEHNKSVFFHKTIYREHLPLSWRAS